MLRSIPGFGIRPRARLARTRHSHAFRASFEAVDDRTLMSTMSAINWGSNTVVCFDLVHERCLPQDINSGGMVWAGAGSPTQISVGLDRAGIPAFYYITPQNQLDFEDLLDNNERVWAS